MRLFLTALKARYGSVEGYVEQALSMNARDLAATLRAHLLETTPAARPPLTLRPATDADAPALVRLRDTAALWQLARGIDQWKPGEKDEAHFRTRIREGEVWLAHASGRLTGAYELWWTDPAAWGPRPPDAGYIHRLMTAPHTSPPGTGRTLLDHAESRIRAAGRPYGRLDCLSTQPPPARLLRVGGLLSGRRTARQTGRHGQPVRGDPPGEAARLTACGPNPSRRRPA
ncbi:Acetyltransferase, GNAT family protein OS=Streptomyces glaucescens OX=1907 GN=SGLAU_19245 PE=4 SV=1 [Streptomyces glaucescens]